MWSVDFLMFYIFKHLFLPVIPSWTFTEKWVICRAPDFLWFPVHTKVYSAGLEPIAMAFSYKATLSQIGAAIVYLEIAVKL